MAKEIKEIMLLCCLTELQMQVIKRRRHKVHIMSIEENTNLPEENKITTNVYENGINLQVCFYKNK